MSLTSTAPTGGHTGSMPADPPDPEVPERARRRTYSAKYKLEILAEYEACDRQGKGAPLRRENLYTSLISEWRKQRDRGALEALVQPRADASPPTRASVKTPGCGARTSGWPPSWPPPARSSRSRGNSRRCLGGSRPAARSAATASRAADGRRDCRARARSGHGGGVSGGGAATVVSLPPASPVASACADQVAS